MSDKIKRCPFCGGEAIIRGFEDWPDGQSCPDEWLAIGCETDGCFGEIDEDLFRFDTEDEAITKWNKRQTQTITEIIAELKSKAPGDRRHPQFHTGFNRAVFIVEGMRGEK